MTDKARQSLTGEFCNLTREIASLSRRLAEADSAEVVDAIVGCVRPVVERRTEVIRALGLTDEQVAQMMASLI